MSLEEFIASISEEYYKRQNKIPTYQYNKIKMNELKGLVDISKEINNDIFNKWFNYSIQIKSIKNKFTFR